MNIFKKLFKKNEIEPTNEPIDSINENYVCLQTDPMNTINDLRQGDWNMFKVRQSLASGMLRYAKQSEVDKAKELGLIK